MLPANFLFERQKMLSHLSRTGVSLLLVAISSLVTPANVNAQVEIERESTSLNVPNSSVKKKRVTAEQFVDDYPYETSRLTFICSRSGKGKVNAGGFGTIGGNYKREFIVQEYFRTDHTLPEANVDIWPAVKGAGVRVVIDVYSLRGEVNINSLFSLAANAEAQNITGTISLQVIGMGGRIVTNTMVSPNNLSSQSIAEVLNTIQTLKSEIYKSTATSSLTSGTSDKSPVPDIHIIPSDIKSPKLSHECE